MTFYLVSLISSETQKPLEGKPCPLLPARRFLPTPPAARIRRSQRGVRLAHRTLPTPASPGSPSSRARLTGQAGLLCFVFLGFKELLSVGANLISPRSKFPRGDRREQHPVRPPRAPDTQRRGVAGLPLAGSRGAAGSAGAGPAQAEPPRSRSRHTASGPAARPGRSLARRPAPQSSPHGAAPAGPARSARTGCPWPALPAARLEFPPAGPALPPGRPTHPMSQSMAARDPPRPPSDTLGPQPAAAGSKHSLVHSHTRTAAPPEVTLARRLLGNVVPEAPLPCFARLPCISPPAPPAACTLLSVPVLGLTS